VSEANERGAQRVCAALAAGALAVFVADVLATVYKQTAGALSVFAADPLSAIYKRPFSHL
jgi:hypothetical protein